MRFPTINDHPLRRVSVPQLSGGINKTDHPSYINDNQLTECNNMWFKDGVLRTRPGVVSKNASGANNCKQLLVKGDNLYWLHNEGVTRLCFNEGEITKIDCNNSNYGTNGKGFIAQVNEMHVVTVIDGAETNCPIHCFDLKDGNSDGAVEPSYIPTVKINVDASSPHETPNGYMYQGYNLLSKDYKIACNTDGEWAWVLPKTDGKIKEIKIEYYDALKGKKEAAIFIGHNDGYATSEIVEVSILKDNNVESTNARFQYWDDYNAVVVQVFKNDESGYCNDTPIVTSQKNGLIITVINEDETTNANKIASMSLSHWFGGTRGGLENGTRLFVAGGEESGIIRWSDLNRPDYFSENNYAYVGDCSRITALAQQDEMLVIFQEHAITYATYMQGAEYTAEDIMNDRIVDITTLSAQFPLTTIHSEIGCDCKDTVRLCNNRLVWLTSDGKVYCLVNNNQYNERNVREISYAIEKLLKQHSKDELKAAKSADVDGKYFLFVGQKVYVLDYGNTSFEYYTYHSHEKRLKNYLSWYVWTLPDYVNTIIGVEGVDGRLCIIANTDNDNGNGTIFEINPNDYGVEDYATDDKAYPISCSMRTKLFAFSGAERMKRIPNCNISVCKIPGEIEVSFVTDNGSGNPRYITIDEEVSEDNHDSVKRMTLYPNANSTCLFGIEMKSDSAMAVEGISISYKEMRERQ